MAEIVEQPEAPPNTAPEPSPEPSSPNAASMDDLLAEYTAGVKEPEDSDDGNMQQLARDALAEHQHGQTDNRVAELQNENALLHQKIHLEAEQADFQKLVGDLQSQLPEHLPADYAETQLMALATKNPEVRAAWDLRNSDRRAVNMELMKVERTLGQLENNPTVDQKNVAALMRYGYRLGLALNSREILRRATAAIASRGNAIREIDHEVTADRFAVAQAVRGASTKVAADPPPNFGKMSNKEFENYKRDHYGF